MPPPDPAAARVPTGYRVEVVMRDLNYFTSVEFDDRGKFLVLPVSLLPLATLTQEPRAGFGQFGARSAAPLGERWRVVRCMRSVQRIPSEPEWKRSEGVRFTRTCSQPPSNAGALIAPSS
ncbi:MAG TPA: hypothetical protein VGR27_04610 [Longimicrobiaceae bacterium]|nr:hypothetical protein [Longimicrobiaceae bacterium]